MNIPKDQYAYSCRTSKVIKLILYSILPFLLLWSSFGLQAQTPGGVGNDLELCLIADDGVFTSATITSWSEQSANGNDVTTVVGPSQLLCMAI